MLAIPKAMLDTLDLSAGAAVELSIQSGRLVIDPKGRPRYSLDELLGRCNLSARRSRADHDWQTSRAAGRELI
jgi:antitoxin ChpS